MIDLLFKVAVNAVALLAAANVVPEFKLVFHNDKPEDWLKIAVIALVFAIVNSYIKPIVKTAGDADRLPDDGPGGFRDQRRNAAGDGLDRQSGQTSSTSASALGGYPPHWGYEAIGCAVVASIVISVVGTVAQPVPGAAQDRRLLAPGQHSARQLSADRLGLPACRLRARSSPLDLFAAFAAGDAGQAAADARRR